MLDEHGQEQHKTLEAAMDEVIVQSERVRNHSMMGMFGLDPNKLDFDYERHFPEHENVSTVPELPRMDQVRKKQLSKRHSIAVPNPIIERDVKFEDEAGASPPNRKVMTIDFIAK